MNPRISLSFNGQCDVAFRFYEAHLPGKLAFILTWGASPMARDVPPDWGAKICHATLEVGDTQFSGSDAPPGTYVAPQGFRVQLDIDAVEEAERVFNALAQNGRVVVALQETFWARRYGMVTDQFGVPWEINCGKPA